MIVFGVGAGSRSKRGKDRKCLVPRVLLEHTESGKCGVLRFHNEKKDNNIKLNKTRTPPFFPKVCVCFLFTFLVVVLTLKPFILLDTVLSTLYLGHVRGLKMRPLQSLESQGRILKFDVVARGALSHVLFIYWLSIFQ